MNTRIEHAPVEASKATIEQKEPITGKEFYCTEGGGHTFRQAVYAGITQAICPKHPESVAVLKK